MRPFLALMAALFLVHSPAIARAGDAATLEILGFSDDGGIFAFEEYGIQDGSGFPYANRFYIDVATDRFMSGTPIRVRIDDESAFVEQARAQARQRGQAVIADEEFVTGYAAGSNAITELSADPFRMAVNPRPVFAPIDPPVEFRLAELSLAPPENCRDLGDMKGFRLTLSVLAPGGQTRLLHDDTRIPQSRGCPLGYMLGGVHTLYPAGAPPAFAVLIAVRGFGFEGPDHRWMAVTGRLPQ